MKKTITLLVGPLAGLSMLALGGCNIQQSSTEQGNRTQETVMQRAIREVPVPRVHHFITRKTVAAYMRRMDKPNHPEYLYIYANTGNIIGYFVAKNPPVNICTFMTPTKREYHVSGGGADPLGPAPALDGVYYGRGGACNMWYFFDANTNALISVKGFNLFMSDQPLSLHASPIRVEQSNPFQPRSIQEGGSQSSQPARQ